MFSRALVRVNVTACNLGEAVLPHTAYLTGKVGRALPRLLLPLLLMTLLLPLQLLLLLVDSRVESAAFWLATIRRLI